MWSAGWIIPGHRERHEGNTRTRTCMYIKVDRGFYVTFVGCTVADQTHIFTAFVSLAG